MTSLSRHMAGDPGTSSQGGLGRVWGMGRVWQTLAVTVINAHEDVLVMSRTSIQGSPSWVLRRRTKFFCIRFPGPDAHAGTGLFRAGSFFRPVGRLTPSGEPGQ